MKQVPVVDLGEIGLHHPEEPSEVEQKRVSREIHDAFSQVGFVYLKNHGICYEKIQCSFSASGRFFHLPTETKENYSKQIEKTFHGYVSRGREILKENARHEVRESYDINCLDGKFPDEEVPEFKASVTDLLHESLQLSTRLLKILALALGLADENFFLNAHKYICQNGNSSAMRVLYYPPLQGEETTAGVTRCGEHSDYGTITLLFQDSVGGLEVQHVDGEWISAKPVEGTILVNVGDLLQFWSDGQYRATRHRVLIPEEELQKQMERRSIVLFIHPDDEVTVKPLNGSDQYPPIGSLEHLQDRFKATYVY